MQSCSCKIKPGDTCQVKTGPSPSTKHFLCLLTVRALFVCFILHALASNVDILDAVLEQEPRRMSLCHLFHLHVHVGLQAEFCEEFDAVAAATAGTPVMLTGKWHTRPSEHSTSSHVRYTAINRNRCTSLHGAYDHCLVGGLTAQVGT